MAQALLNRLNRINVTERVIEDGRDIGTFAAAIIDYTRAYPYSETDSTVLTCLKACSYAEGNNTTVIDVLEHRHINAIFGIAPVYPENYDDDEKMTMSLGMVEQPESAILVVGLKALRSGSNENKKNLSFQTTIPTPPAALGKAYDVWSSVTTAEMKVRVVKAIRTAFINCGQVPLQLAAERLCGRGFTSCMIFVSLVSSVKTEAGRQALCQIAASYAAELGELIGLVEWLAGDPSRYNFGFYTGIPENHGSKKYPHLSSLALRCLPATTLKGYAGSSRQAAFPQGMEALIETIKQSCLHVELVAYDAQWLTVLNSLRASVLAVSEPPAVPQAEGEHN